MATVKKNHVDPMTGLKGFDAFQLRLRSQLEGAGNIFSLGLVDLDWFGKVNREYGRDVGDGLIVELGKALSTAFKGRGEVLRYGGDAFMVMLDGVEKEEAFLMLEKFREDFDCSHEVEASGRKAALDVTVSMGVASYPDDGVGEQELLRKVSGALYRAKVRGRNKVSLSKEERMLTKTSHYTQGQLEGLSRLAKREALGEAALLREALDDLLRKHNS